MAVCSQSTRRKENPSAIVFFAALMSLGLHIVSAAPTSCENDNEWWTNPCFRPTTIRHGRSPSKDQSLVFIKKIDTSILKKLRDLYPHNQELKSKGPCLLQVKKMMKPIKTANNHTMAVKYLYSTMIQIAQYMNKLKCITPKTHVNFDIEKRAQIFKEAKGYLRLVMCEYNDEHHFYDDSSVLPNVAKIGNKCLSKPMDLGSLQMRDTDFFKKLKKFIKQSYRKINTLRKKRGKKHKNKKQ